MEHVSNQDRPQSILTDDWRWMLSVEKGIDGPKPSAKTFVSYHYRFDEAEERQAGPIIHLTSTCTYTSTASATTPLPLAIIEALSV
jgi:hypothetical protein